MAFASGSVVKSDFGDPLTPSCRRWPRIKNLRLGCPLAVMIDRIRLGCAVQLTCGKEYCCGPCWEKIESGDQLRGKGGKKSPVPSQQLDEDSANCDVQCGIKRREAAFNKQGHAHNLDRVGQDGDKPRLA